MSLYRLCSDIEKVVQMNMESMVNGRRDIACRLMEVVSQAINVYSYPMESVCSLHQQCYLTYAIKLYLRLHIHYFVLGTEN